MNVNTNMRKPHLRLLAIALSLAMLLALLPVTAFAAAVKIDTQNYAFDGDTGTLTIKTNAAIATDKDTGEYLDGNWHKDTRFSPNDVESAYILNSVTSIGALAFVNCGVTSITIPNSVTSIGVGAFMGCTLLTSVTIPDSVTSIGSGAFYGCSSLTTITIPNSVSSISDRAFFNCSSLTSVTISAFVTSIEAGTFLSCRSLSSITIPDSVTSIGDGAFGGCESLTSIAIPDSVTSIGSSAFYGCSSLRSITIPDSVASIGNGAFSCCYSLTSVAISNSVTSIGDSTFAHCYSLSSVTIPDSVTSIGIWAFQMCSSLNWITIPSSVTSIGNSAFSECLFLRILLTGSKPPTFGAEWAQNTPRVFYPAAWGAPDTMTNLNHSNNAYAIIDMAAIGGVTAPVSGANPVGAIAETAQYTGTVTWSPPDSTFKENTVYTATITLTPKAGFTLMYVPKNFFTVAGATSVSNGAFSGVIKAEFPTTGTLITSLTNRLEIYNGDTANFAVTINSAYTGDRSGTWSVADGTIASVEDNSTAPITINRMHTIPGTVRAKVTGLKPGTTTVTFTNTATGATGSCTVSVKPAFSIAPNSLTVYAGETGSLAVAFDDDYKGSRDGSWSVDDNTIASIDQNGVVTGKRAGTVIATYLVHPKARDRATTDNGASIGVAIRESALEAFAIAMTVPIEVKPATLTVSFDPDGGSPKPPSVTVPHDTTVAKPDDPSLRGMKFLGWYTALSGGTKWDFANDKVTADMTLYASWAKKATRSETSLPVYTAPTITGMDTIALMAGYSSANHVYTFSGNPAPTYGISPTEPNTANATFAETTLTIPPGLGVGSYGVTLTATSSAGTATKTVTVNVYPVIRINFVTEIEFFLSREDNRIDAFDGAGGPYTFTLSPGSSMPSGLTLNPDGTITGTAATGVYPPVSVVISDCIGNSITTTMLAVRVSD